MEWTHEQEARLRKLRVEDGLTYAQIAPLLGASRSAVCAKAMRLGLKNHCGDAQPRSDQRERSEVTRRARRAPVSVQKVSVPDVVPGDENAGGIAAPNDPPQARAGQAAIPSSVAPDPRGDLECVPLLDLKRHHCRWPFGHGGDITFCGTARDEGSSYCPAHRAVATRPLRHPRDC